MRSSFREFHNALRILRTIERPQFPGPADHWVSFRSDPMEYFVTCEDRVARAIFRVIESRKAMPDPHAVEGRAA